MMVAPTSQMTIIFMNGSTFYAIDSNVFTCVAVDLLACSYLKMFKFMINHVKDPNV